MPNSNRLGEYLRARRELVQPEDVGLPPGGRRRVQGLRREELALLAGISSDYYMRLEQGRDLHPSDQVLDALAKVLQLTPAATTHLRELAHPADDGRRIARTIDDVPASLVQLVNSWTATPAYVQDRLMNVLVSNSLAVELSATYRAGSNLLREILLDPTQREFRREWDLMTANGVAGLRLLVGPNTDDPDLLALVNELSEASARFRELWNRHDVSTRVGGTIRLNHPEVGPLDLHSEKLQVNGPAGLTVCIFHADPDTPSAEALAKLAARN